MKLQFNTFGNQFSTFLSLREKFLTGLTDLDFMSIMKQIHIINMCLTQNNRDTVKLVFYSITKYAEIVKCSGNKLAGMLAAYL